MKNIEKYHYTQEALDVYNSLSLNNVPFNEWLQSEVEGMGEDTLLEASEWVLKVCDMCHCITKWAQMPYEEGGAK